MTERCRPGAAVPCARTTELCPRPGAAEDVELSVDLEYNRFAAERVAGERQHVFQRQRLGRLALGLEGASAAGETGAWVSCGGCASWRAWSAACGVSLAISGIAASEPASRTGGNAPVRAGSNSEGSDGGNGKGWCTGSGGTCQIGASGSELRPEASPVRCATFYDEPPAVPR